MLVVNNLLPFVVHFVYMQKREQLSEDTTSDEIQSSPKSIEREKSPTRTKDDVYERDFTQDEVISSALAATTFFLGASTALSYGMLELIDYVYTQVGATNNYLWVGILFALNSILILLIRDFVLPYVMKKEFSLYRNIKEEYFKK
jgi:hypothetical protein